jgi:phage terminase large subunit-like protein
VSWLGTRNKPDRELYDTLAKGVAARRQPIVVLITTAGDDQDSVCYEEYEYAKRVMAGVIEDETYLPVVFEAEEEDDWRLPATWAKSNPSLDVTVKRDYLEAECRAAIAEPRKQGAFKRLHLNVWTRQSEVWIPVEWWKACPPLPASLTGLPVAGGLDLSSTTDLTAFVLAFRLPPTTAEAPKVEVAEIDAAGAPVKRVLSVNYDLAVIPYLWMPEDRLRERSKEDGIDYGVWVRAGHLRTTPGSVVDYDFIFRAIVDEIAPRYRLKQIGYDPWNALQFALQLEKAGFEPVEVRQGPRTLSAPCKVLHALTKARRVHHDGNHAMTWCVANAAVKEDENENIRPVKTNPKKRIDGVVAAVTALSRLMVLPERRVGRAHVSAV